MLATQIGMDLSKSLDKGAFSILILQEGTLFIFTNIIINNYIKAHGLNGRGEKTNSRSRLSKSWE